MDFWIKAAQLVLSLAILITLHEFGHYLAARAFKIRVEKFYLFFDPWFSLLKKKIGDTEWGIGWLPLGGYVKIAGMVDESMDKEQLSKPPQPDEFRSKPAWQRLIVMIAGVTVNVIFGIVIYIVVVAAWGDNVVENKTLKYGLAVNPNFTSINADVENGDIITAVDGETVENVRLINLQIFLRGARTLEVKKENGETKTVQLEENIDDKMWEQGAVMAFSPRVHTVVDSILPETGAEEGGLLAGDSIVEVNGKPTPFYNDFQQELMNRTADTVKFELAYYREGIAKTAEIHGVWNEEANLYTFGFLRSNPDWLEVTHRDFKFGESIGRGIQKAGWTMYDYAAQLPLIFTSKGAQSVGGFGAIGNLFPPTWDWKVFWANTAFISLVLAIMNILPIPALDGGHIMFLLYEMITGKEAPQKVLEYAQLIGFIFLISLFLYANGNDVYRAFFE